MTREELIASVWPVADLLVRGDVEAALSAAPESRCSSADLRRVLTEHPVPLRTLSEADFRGMDIIEIERPGPRSFDVRLDLPARDGGYGDLTLVMIIVERSDGLQVGIEDLLTP